MPTHVYRPERNPPNWWDRLLVHPMDITAAAIMLFLGILAGSSLSIDFAPSKAMEEFPALLVFVVSGFLIFGGILILVGLNWWGDEVSRGWALERLGWLLGAGGLLTYGGTVVFVFPESLFSYSIPVILGLGSIIRFWSIVQIEKTTRKTLYEVKGGPHGH